MRSTSPNTQRTLADTLSRAVFEGLLATTLCFAAAAYGAVEAWAEAILLWLVAALALAALACQVVSPKNPGRPWLGIYVLVAAFVGLVVLQVLPLPSWLVDQLAANSAEIYQHFGYDLQAPPDDTVPNWLAVSLYPAGTWHDLRLLAACSIVLVLVTRHLRSLAAIKRLFAYVTAVGVVLAFLTLIQTYAWKARPFNVWQVPGLGHPPLGPPVNPNQFAVFANLVVGFGVGLLLVQVESIRRHRLARHLSWPSTFSDWRTVGFALLAVGIGLLVGMTFLSLSRGGMVASLGGACGLAGVLLLRQRAGLRTWAVTLVAAAAITLVGWFGWQPVADELATLDRPWKQIVEQQTRLPVWKDTLVAATSHAAVGTGLGTFEMVYPMYRTVEGAGLFLDAHNEFVQLVMEMGIAGTVLALCFLAAVAFRLGHVLRPGARPEVTALACGCLYAITAGVIQSNFTAGMHVPANALLFAILCAAILALPQKRSFAPMGKPANPVGDDHPAQRDGRKASMVWRRTADRVTTTALAVVAALFAFDATKTAWAVAHDNAAWACVAPYTASDRSIPQDRYVAAARHLRAALTWYPQDAKIRYGRAALAWHHRFGHLSGDELREAVRRPANATVVRDIRTALQETRRMAPTFGYSHLLLAQMDALSGADLAEAFARRAVQLLPTDPDAWFAAGNLELAAGRISRACGSYRRTIALGGHRERIVSLFIDDPQLVNALPEALPNQPVDLLFAAEKVADTYPELAAKLLVRARKLVSQDRGRGGADPTGVSALAALGRVEWRLGDLEAAAHSFGRAIDLDYDNVGLRQEYARLLHDLGREAEAEQQLRVCVRINPNDSPSRGLLDQVVGARIRAQGRTPAGPQAVTNVWAAAPATEGKD